MDTIHNLQCLQSVIKQQPTKSLEYVLIRVLRVGVVEGLHEGGAQGNDLELRFPDLARAGHLRRGLAGMPRGFKSGRVF